MCVGAIVGIPGREVAALLPDGADLTFQSAKPVGECTFFCKVLEKQDRGIGYDYLCEIVYAFDDRGNEQHPNPGDYTWFKHRKVLVSNREWLQQLTAQQENWFKEAQDRDEFYKLRRYDRVVVKNVKKFFAITPEIPEAELCVMAAVIETAAQKDRPLLQLEFRGMRRIKGGPLPDLVHPLSAEPGDIRRSTLDDELTYLGESASAFDQLAIYCPSLVRFFSIQDKLSLDAAKFVKDFECRQDECIADLATAVVKMDADMFRQQKSLGAGETDWIAKLSDADADAICKRGLILDPILDPIDDSRLQARAREVVAKLYADLTSPRFLAAPGLKQATGPEAQDLKRVESLVARVATQVRHWLQSEGSQPAGTFWGKFRKFDKVVLQDPVALLPRFFKDANELSKPVIAIVSDTVDLDTEGVVDLRLRLIWVRGKLVSLIPKAEDDQYKIKQNVRFFAHLNDIRPATAEDELACSSGPSKYDKMATCYPRLFLQTIANGNWETVKEWWRPKGQLQLNLGGMNAMLEYRDWLCEYVLGLARRVTTIRSASDRSWMVFMNSPDPLETFSALHKGDIKNASISRLLAWFKEQAAFLSSAKEIAWQIAGSTDATSDIDVSTSGDGIEFAVILSNWLYRWLHGNREPGIVYDVNLYAQDFVPEFQDEFSKRTPPARPIALVPEYPHIYSNQKIKEQDSQWQLFYSALHMRRYMTADEWGGTADESGGFVDKAREQLRNCRGRGAEWFTNEIEKAVKDAYLWLCGKLEETINEDKAKNLDPDAFEQQLLVLQKANPNGVMAAQNTLYERCLYSTQDARVTFHWRKFRSRLAPSQSASDVDQAYFSLRQGVSEACYFANECYATEGSVVQVVGGKQLLSRGVGIPRKTKHFNNIELTPDQLMQSMNEQIGDFFKESTREERHQKDADPRKPYDETKAYGAAILKASKYLHRYFNAMKRFYSARFHSAPVELVLEMRDDDDAPVELVFEYALFVPSALSGKEEAFSLLRQACGFGLERLKRFNPEGASSADLEQLSKSLALEEVPKVPLELPLNKETLARNVVEARFRALNLAGLPAPATLERLKQYLIQLHAYVLLDYCNYTPWIKAYNAGVAGPARFRQPASKPAAVQSVH